MFIIIFLLSPFLGSSNNDFYQKISIPVYDISTIEKIEDKGLIYKYYLTEETNKFTLTTYCKAQPSYLKMDIQYFLRTSQLTERQFQKDFINGTYHGEASLIKKVIATNYGIIVLTTDKFIELLNLTDAETANQKVYVGNIDILKNTELIYFEESNKLLLLNNELVLEYEIITNDFSDYQLKYARQFLQSSIDLREIKQLKIFGLYIFILHNDGALLIYNNELKLVRKLEINLIYFDFSLDKKIPKIIYIDENSKLQAQLILIDEDLQLDIDSSFEEIDQFANVFMFVEYQTGILLIVEQDQGCIIIDYSFLNEEWIKIRTQYVQLKIKNIIIELNYAILICENTQKIITVGIDGKYANQLNYKQKNIDIISGLKDILIFDQKKTQMDTLRHFYAFTRTKVLKLNLKQFNFSINCTCQNKTEALNSPYNVKLTYFSTAYGDSEIVRQYIVNFNYAILTQESMNQVWIGVMIAITLFFIIVLTILNKYLQYRKCIQQASNGTIVFETVQTSPKDISMSDNKLEFNSVAQEKAI